jgi:hypothetical protein
VSGDLSSAQAMLARALGPLEGQEIPGGCDECNAFQTADPVKAGVWVISVHHDVACPVAARIERDSA